MVSRTSRFLFWIGGSGDDQVVVALYRPKWRRQQRFSIARPAPRALSPIVFEPKSKCFILFGGDHCDYLTNNTWSFNPANLSWKRMRPPSAPPPRANHKLKALGDGTIELSGGYTYTSTTDYMGGQYRDLNDGKWIYNVEKDAWTGGAGVPANGRVSLRTGPFMPRYFLQGLALIRRPSPIGSTD